MLSIGHTIILRKASQFIDENIQKSRRPACLSVCYSVFFFRLIIRYKPPPRSSARIIQSIQPALPVSAGAPGSVALVAAAVSPAGAGSFFCGAPLPVFAGASVGFSPGPSVTTGPAAGSSVVTGSAVAAGSSVALGVVWLPVPEDGSLVALGVVLGVGDGESVGPLPSISPKSSPSPYRTGESAKATPQKAKKSSMQKTTIILFFIVLLR